MKKVTIVACSHEFPIEISDREPVLEIKRKMEQLLGVPVPAQTLSIFGWELIDGLDMEDYPIVTHGTRIDLTVKPTSKKIPITVKLPSRHVTTVEVDTSDTVRSLKEKIHVVAAPSSGTTRMSLFYSGVELEDDFRNLSEYGVHEFAEIVVFVKPMGRPKGGGGGMGREASGGPGDRALRLVVQTASCLLNGASIPVELEDSSTVSDLRELLLRSKSGLPRDDYIFIHRQRIMRENCSLRWHGVQNGEVVYVFKGTVSRAGN
ncbi:unnamed protein product [Linum tenue]|uniref:Ubiquitin-like domain-containing protein n=1 Tax=Linum tenue TaxID=586396 RepID=A0AAV0QZY9_9ROSI|nr:unnamed protein product [Linum tenue]